MAARGDWLPYEVWRERHGRLDRRVWDAVLRRDGFRCRHCGDWRNLSVDHLIPRSAGGTNDPDNLQALCRRCNSRKGARVEVIVGCAACGRADRWFAQPGEGGRAGLDALLATPCSGCGAAALVVVGSATRPLELPDGGMAEGGADGA
jgi:hypothetical protein